MTLMRQAGCCLITSTEEQARKMTPGSLWRSSRIAGVTPVV